MYYMHPTHYRPARGPRKGMVLLIVIAMLALFSSVALAFVFYAESAATGAQVTNGALTRTVPDANPELLLTYFLSQLIYDSENTRSAMRGHSLARTMYGYNGYSFSNFPNTPLPNPLYGKYGLNYTPYSGVGRIHNVYQPTDPAPLAGQDDYFLPSYVYYPSDGFVRHPEFYGYVPVPNMASVPPAPSPASYRAGNAPYTYPDMNNMFLAQVGADGTVRAISFDRPYLLANAANKYGTLYVNNTYHTGLSLPDADGAGHVRNLDIGPGTLVNGTYYNNDSKWMDLGWPVMIAPNGKKYIVLFAPLVTDLDNRLNMMVSGNPAAISNRGYGASDIRLSSASSTGTAIPNLVSPANNLAELQWLYQQRVAPGLAAYWPWRDGPAYASIDFDSRNGGPLTLPGPFGTAGNNFFIWPNYGSAYPPAVPWYNAATELVNHPLGYNYLADVYQDSIKGNRPILRALQLEAILRFMGTGAPAVPSALFKNMPTTFANTRSRGLLTSISMGLDRITAAPYIPFSPANPPAAWVYGLNPGSAYPTLNSAVTNVPTALLSPSFANAAPAGSEFTAAFNSALVARLRVNLNRLNKGVYDNNNKLFQFDFPTPDNTGAINTAAPYATTPPWGSAGWTYGNQYQYALSFRQQLARDVFNVLVMVTGAGNPNPAFDPNTGIATPNSIPTLATLSPTGYSASRWLAQLAVNIVDYMDNDDFITPFNWDLTNNGLVYGTEQPRLVLNEVYAQLDNNKNDAGVAIGNPGYYNLNVWAELQNPFNGTPGQAYPSDAGAARLKVGNNVVYQIYLLNNDPAFLRKPDGSNVDGTPNPQDYLVSALGVAPFNQMPVDDWGINPVNGGKDGAGNVFDPTVVLPNNGAFYDNSISTTPLQGTNKGFYVLGPNFPAANYVPNAGVTQLPYTSLSNKMTQQLTPTQGQSLINGQNPGITVLLRRLACPSLPSDPNQFLPAPSPPNTPNPYYNPYITVDYSQNIPVNDNRAVLPTGPVVPVPANFYAVGRLQPYAAAGLMAQINQPIATQPKNTFFQQNSPMNGTGKPPNTPFDWLTHLDRPLVNSLELLHVSGFHPHELTRQFVIYNVNQQALPVDYNPLNNPPLVVAKFAHRAPWTDEPRADQVLPNYGDAAMIFRALELLGVPSYQNGTTNGGRVPGRININTANELEIFLALADPQNNNNFSNFNAADVAALFQNLIASRTPNNGVPSLADTPFKSLATAWVNPETIPPGQYSKGSGIRDTLLRNNLANGQPLFWNTGVPNGMPLPTHPYQRWELLQKIYNNVTTTSNVFAVWITAGFFEVDDSFNPPKILSEIGRDQNMQIRHRMFAIVDRTQLTLFRTFATGNIAGGGPAGTRIKLATVMPVSGTTVNGGTWSLQPGMLLDIGVPGNKEVVAVRTDVTGNLVGDFTLSWQLGTPITCRGNPGPYMTSPPPPSMQYLYNHRTDPAVLHYSVIK